MAKVDHVDHFGSLYDPIHGTLDLADAVPADTFVGSLATAVRSPLVDRLRRIKQLGFASYQFVGADHSRYAHALGTMHMMRALLRRLAPSLRVDAVSRLRNRLPAAERVFSQAEAAGVNGADVLTQYTLAAALFQDVGELPYETATGLIFKPDEETQRRVAQHVGHDVYAWEPKKVFGIASLIDSGSERSLKGFDLQLLAFLIVGRQYPWISEEPQLRAWLNLLEGEVDADRLDYVYRDAHHTVGVRGDPQSVVESLVEYDEIGPVVSDVGPVIDFLATRANLWRSVYLSPQNRFRRLLLVVLLRDIFFNENCAPCAQDFVHSHQVAPLLGMVGFKTLDDVWLWERLRQISESRLKRNLSVRASVALELLLSERADYEHAWVRPWDGAASSGNDTVLPDELFFDTYQELYRHHFYEPGSVRIHSHSLRFLRTPLALEDASFGGFMAPDWTPLPVLKAAQVFMPIDRQGAQWDQVQSLLDSGGLYEVLFRNDLISQLEVPTDTRTHRDCKGPDIFISFRWDNVDIVDEVLRELYSRRRRYHALRGSYEGLGGTTADNSRAAAREGEAALVIASVEYGAAYKNDPNGNIHIEIDELVRRRDKSSGSPIVPLVFLSIDPWRDIERTLPWQGLGFATVPTVGEGLRGQPRSRIVKAVDVALQKIDSEYDGPNRF